MTLFITKKGLEASTILDPAFWSILIYSILLKTGKKRGIFDRKHNLSIKGCLVTKKIYKYAISREMNTVEN